MLKLEQIHTNRGPAHILRGVSLEVKDGEAICLVGRNGAGKTTTMESIMGLLPMRSGRITAVIIEHDMDVVFKYSDRIVVMHEGTILADGTPDEIRANEQVTTTLLGTHASGATDARA